MKPDYVLIPSCDDRNDAVNSIARLYGVSPHHVNEITLRNWPDFVDWEDGVSPFDDAALLNWLFSKALGVDWKCEITMACFYHRTRYDGCASWFANGILDAKPGATKILDSIRAHLSNEHFIKANACALANIEDRDQGLDYVGPYAFNTYAEAKGAEVAGLYYDVPEFLTGHRYWDPEFSEFVSQVFLTHLKPAIVKFAAPVVCSEKYVASLWHHLYRSDFEMDFIPLTHSKASGVVPAANLIKIFDI